jgi:hypothetical protein
MFDSRSKVFRSFLSKIGKLQEHAFFESQALAMPNYEPGLYQADEESASQTHWQKAQQSTRYTTRGR